MKRKLTGIDRALDRFVADITAIIREHAERAVAETLARRGLKDPDARSRRGRGARGARAADRAAKQRSGARASASRGRRKRGAATASPEQLSLF
ncbi:MAG TPA: hypothetical protein VKY73_05875 [Polyangiaceae bacterium]|nr:hypothetical protein [Polyangiaceae bacterium]